MKHRYIIIAIFIGVQLIYSGNSFASNEKINQLSKGQVRSLYKTAKIWGYLKYFSPVIAKGKLDWDSVLIGCINNILHNPDSPVRDGDLLRHLVESANVPAKNITNRKFDPRDSNLSWITDTMLLSSWVSDQLVYLYFNHRGRAKNFYVTCKSSDRYSLYFCNEKKYPEFDLPTLEYRLLAVFRYWNMINYFYPYRDIALDWDNTLMEFIPKMVNVESAYVYGLKIFQLSSRIEDSHGELAYTKFNAAVYENYFSLFEVRMIEDKAIVTDIFRNLPGKNTIQVGDEIIQMRGKPPLQTCMDSFRNYMKFSNKPYTDWYIANMIVMSANDSIVPIMIRRGEIVKEVTVRYYPIQEFWSGHKDYFHGIENTSRILDGNIGYINLSKIRMPQVDSIFKAMGNTDALIFDMRGYPNIPWDPDKILKYLLPRRVVPTQYFYADLENPGRFKQYRNLKTGPRIKHRNYYKGQVIILVNERTKSAAEYVTMMFQARKTTITIGSQTAGSDGASSRIYLPGNAMINYSSEGVRYPDGTATQRHGVRINLVVHPTVKGISEGRDEILDAAIDVIKRGSY